MALPSTTNVSRPTALGYGALLDDLYLRLAVSPNQPLDIQTAPLEAPRLNTAAYAVTAGDEIRNEFGLLFSRSDFSGGEGLDFAHRRTAAAVDASRYWDSQHVDISNPTPGQPAKIQLLPPTTRIDASANTNLCLAYDGTTLFMGNGISGRKCSNPTATTPTFADEDPNAGEAGVTVLDLTNIGTDVYAALNSNGIHKRSGGSWAHWSATAALKVWGLKRMLLASTGAVLDNMKLTDGTVLTTLATLGTGDTWIDACDAGAAILVSATDGNIYAFANNASSGALELKAQTPVNPGEVPYALGYDGVHIFFATREATASGSICRFYRASLDSTAYVLVAAEELRQWGTSSSTIDYSPRKIVATRDAVFFGMYETAGSSWWRYHTATGGLSRDLSFGVTGTVVDGLSVSGRLFATVSASGIYREATGTYETSGYIMGPLADFFYASDKSWAGAILEHDQIASDCRIELYYTTDPLALQDSTSSSWIRVKNVMSGQDNTESALTGVQSRYLAGMVKLFANTGATVTPTVRSFTYRAYPGHGDVIVNLPVACGDIIEMPGRRRQPVRGLGDRIYGALKGKEGQAATLQIFRPPELIRGAVVQVGTRVVEVTSRGATQDVALVQFRGRRVSTSNIAASSSAFGIGEYGLMFFGGRES